MPNIRFLIIEKSYIIRQGIKTILHDMAIYDIHEDTDYELPINQIIEKIKPQVIIFNHKLLKQNTLFPDTIDFYKNKIKLVVIKGQNKRIIESKSINLMIDINSPKATIINNIYNLIDKISPLSKNEQTSELTEREIDVLKYVAKGNTNKEIADKLYISTHTVISHRKNITGKIGIKSVAGLTIYALINKIITDDELNEIQ